MNNYNEPTADARFVEQVATLRSYGLPPAVLTNGSGLTPQRVDELLAVGGLRYLSVNLSTLDRERYRRDREADHLPVVLRNLTYLKDIRLAPRMEIVVLGQGDDVHRRDVEEIRARFEGTCFDVKRFEIMDRAGRLPIGLKPPAPKARLCGCDNVGSRPVEHLHITAKGTCVLCCEDYDARYVVGDLTIQSVADVLAGPELAKFRRWTYGEEDAPEDFMCRQCVFARALSTP
jgi:MoaA/NifB/PqqE/SkfB family radical SAM enzyme